MEDRIQEFRRRVSATRPPNLGYHHPKDDHILDESEGKKLPISKKGKKLKKGQIFIM